MTIKTTVWAFMLIMFAYKLYLIKNISLDVFNFPIFHNFRDLQSINISAWHLATLERISADRDLWILYIAFSINIFFELANCWKCEALIKSWIRKLQNNIVQAYCFDHAIVLTGACNIKLHVYIQYWMEILQYFPIC